MPIKVPFVRFACLPGLVAVTVLVATVGSGAAGQNVPSAGFELPAIKGSYPGRTFDFDGEQAKRLARSMMPVLLNDVARVSVYESIMLPVGVYSGLTFDFALTADADYSDRVCEERHLVVVFRYQGPDVDQRETRSVVRDGTITDHAFEGLGWNNRYLALPEKAVSHDVARAACRALATDTSRWENATDASAFAERLKRLAALAEALRTLPRKKIHCVEWNGSRDVSDGPLCGREGPKIADLVKSMPPTFSDSMAVSDEAVTVSVFDYFGRGDPAKLDYRIILRSGFQDRPLSVSVRLSKSAPPPQV